MRTLPPPPNRTDGPTRRSRRDLTAAGLPRPLPPAHRPWLGFFWIAASLIALSVARPVRAREVAVIPAADGSLGAWLLAGPLSRSAADSIDRMVSGAVR